MILQCWIVKIYISQGEDFRLQPLASIRATKSIF